MVLNTRLLRVAGDVSREGRWGSDGACLKCPSDLCETAMADVQIVDGNGNVVTSVDTNEYVLPSALSDGNSAAFIDQMVAQTEYRVRIVGLTSQEIQYLTVTSDVGDQFQSAATSGSITVGQSQVPYVESSVPFVIADNGGQPLTAAQQAQILSQFGVNAVDPGHIVDVGGMAEAKATLEAFKKQLPVTPPTGGLDVTQALVYGSERLKYMYNKLTYPQKMELAMRLIYAPYALYSWDIATLKFNATESDSRTHQTMCVSGQGKNDTKPYTLVTVRDGQGKLEAYPTDAVNYFLYGEATGLIYKDWDKIDAYVANISA